MNHSKGNHYTEVANECLERITQLKKESRVHSSVEEKQMKTQKLLDAYNNYVNIIKPQLENSGIEYYQYNSKIESIIKSV